MALNKPPVDQSDIKNQLRGGQQNSGYQAPDKKDSLKDYVEVNVRIERFYEKYPNGRIITDLLSWENGVVVMKAFVYRDLNDTQPSATGHAYEKEGSSFINKTSALENCETSAVGRALAMLGFEIKKSIASKEEVDNAKLNQNKPDNDNQIISESIKENYQKWHGSLDGIESWYASQKAKFNDKQIEFWLTNQIKKFLKGDAENA